MSTHETSTAANSAENTQTDAGSCVPNVVAPTSTSATATTTTTTPSLTTMTTATSQAKINSYIEFENQFILRMPVVKKENGSFQLHSATIALREAMAKVNINTDEAGNVIDPLKDRLFIDLNVDTRKGNVKFGRN